MTPSIGATYPLDQVPEAMRYLEAGKARGKQGGCLGGGAARVGVGRLA